MPYEHFARLHAALLSLRREDGQGTVEYVGVVIVVAAVIAAIATQFKADNNIATSVVEKIRDAVDDAGKPTTR